ncbi:MAG TPA: sensor domain-containing diguanylate cyclase [Flexistipes sinusarabici]|uniref:Sensor domain-containing diguanylate cyclase n=1 Tax=Flexistipes sinusarabici TaxID=2352 RepID=A0A3D5QD21_FLESI|nr:sensor domain-containing diguanylate cyclase [Flexistipes sinusarabici]
MSISEETYYKIVDSLHEGLYTVDRDRIVTYWNRAAEKLTGFTSQEVIGKSCSNNILTHIDKEGNNLCSWQCPLSETMTKNKTFEAKVFMHHKKGHRIPLSVRTNTIIDKDGKVKGGIELFTDLSNLLANKLRIKELEKLALLDSLTQSANRRYVEMEMISRFEEKNRFDMPFGVIFMDIDNFRNFNETHGHNVGDKVLKFVANTLISNSRSFDIFGRWGGEEFIGVIKNVNQKELKDVANRILMLVRKSYILHEGKKLNVTISAEATMAKDGDNVESVINRADEFLYRSKNAGKNCLTIN